MRVLLTGNLGYIGPVVTAALKRAGHEVMGLDTGWFLPNLAAPPEWPEEQVFGDIREDGLFLSADAIVHLAGLSNDPMGALNESLTERVNLDGTLNLIASHPDIRHVIVSSCSVYGAAEMATEETPVAPQTAYATAKAAVDYYVQRRNLRGLNAVSLRLGTVYGWSPGMRLDLVVNRMTYDATHGLGITVTGNAARPLTHIEDVASAIVFMLDRPETGVFNVVGENWRMRDLAETIAWATKAKIREQDTGSGDARDYMASAAKLEALGWQSEWGVGDALADLLRAGHILGLGSPFRYERLHALKDLIRSGYLDSDLRHERIAA